MKRLMGFIALLGFVLGLALLTPTQTLAADTVSVAKTIVQQPTPSISGITKYTFTFSSDDGTIARAAANSAANVIGWIAKVQYVPGAVNTPDAAADIQLYTHLTTGVNILYGLLDNVGATETIDTPVSSAAGVGVFLGGETLYFSAASLGAGTNDGVLYVWVITP